MSERAPQMSFDEAVVALTGPEGPYPVIEKEIGGRKLPVFKNLPPALRHLFAVARTRADEVFLVYEDERWTFGDVMQKVDATAALLVERYGVERGDRVAIAMRNYPEFITTFAAATSIGATAVLMNAWWTPDEMEYGLEDCGARVLVADAERIERALPCRDRLGFHAVSVRVDAPPAGVDRLTDMWNLGTSMPDLEVGPEDDATILYTSGTTGRPKGAVSTHHAVLSALGSFAARAAINRTMYPPEEEHPWPHSFILVVPLFHVTGLVPVMLSCFAAGYKLVMMYKWDAERALELVERERVTQFVGVPTQSWDLLETPGFASRDTSSLTNVGGGGAPAPAELIRRIDKGFKKGAPGIGYGMTETNAFGPGNSGPDILRKPRSAGRTMPTMPVEVRDESGVEVPRGEIGEIWFTGANLIRGYWNRPEATAETIVDGWLRSGDLGRMDEEGFIYVEDRAKDMVLRGGENVYCAEVEAAIYDQPGIHEAAVFGLPHERLGEEVACAIVLKPGGSLDPERFRVALAEKIANFKVPSVFRVYAEPLPRNASGKILKRQLRDEIVAARGGA
ncbi:MAG: acyl--CoA ligase [Proteobacteria bacterium]|nr:acyl--CoA ligase [Pseudomonadota bacterium]